ncbi:MAG TPA: pilin [Gammaproteobacteria bacterium]|nr:pilin [Gammaproteobacteria bacterium]
MIRRNRGVELGVTLIELVIVIGATCVIIAVGVSGYRTYTIRREVIAGMQLAEHTKAAVAAAFTQSHDVPADGAGLATYTQGGLAKSGPFVESIDVVDGRIDIVFGNGSQPAIADRRLSLTPYETAGLEIVWLCGNEIPGPGLEPLGFASGGRQPLQIATTVEARYLPSRCR